MTLTFALVMAAVLSITGWVVFGLFRADLNRGIDRALLARSDEVAALVGQNNDSVSQSLQGVSGREDDLTQVLSAAGRPLTSTPQLRRALIARSMLSRVTARGYVFESTGVPGVRGRLRLRAVPVQAGVGEGVVLVVATTLTERDDSLRELAELLVAGGLAALLLASLAGYGLATAALRPVEAMRRRAQAISPGDSGQRLPVPPSGDELTRLGETLNAMLDRLQTAFARERVFAADASHELRTPLAVLKTEIELALRRGRSPAELRGALESAAEETDRLIRLAEDLLVLAQLDEGRLPLRASVVASSELLRGVAARFQARAVQQGCELRVRAPAQADLRADRERLEQALGNLLDNALRHASREVCLEATARDSMVELHVRDDGAGFRAEVIGHAFERFFRGDSEGADAGAGLGLAIVTSIAASHGGSVHAANPPGGGADVWLVLPAAPPGGAGGLTAERNGLATGFPARTVPAARPGP